VTGERRAMFERFALTLTNLLRQKQTLDGIAIFVIDLLDPLGYALGCALRARVDAPDPAALIRRALGESAPVRPIMVGTMKPAKLADVAERTAPGFDDVAAELRAPELPGFLVPVVVVADAGAELSYLQVVISGPAIGVA
jgi:hypothetical protein